MLNHIKSYANTLAYIIFEDGRLQKLHKLPFQPSWIVWVLWIKAKLVKEMIVFCKKIVCQINHIN